MVGVLISKTLTWAFRFDFIFILPICWSLLAAIECNSIGLGLKLDGQEGFLKFMQPWAARRKNPELLFHRASCEMGQIWPTIYAVVGLDFELENTLKRLQIAFEHPANRTQISHDLGPQHGLIEH